MPILRKATSAKKKHVTKKAKLSHTRKKTAAAKKPVTSKRKVAAARRKPTLATSQRGFIRRLALSKPRNKKQLAYLLFLLAFAIVGGAYMVFRSSAATTTLATLEAEAMPLPPGAQLIDDPAASAAKAMLFKSNGEVAGQVTLTSDSSQITIRAKGIQCQGAPQMVLKVDNIVRQTSAVSSSSWTDYIYNLSLPAGSHTIGLSFTNDNAYTHKNARKNCSRDLFLDKVTLYGTVPDAAPAISTIVTVPTNGSTISGGIPVEAAVRGAADPTVEFYLDNTLYRTESLAPYCMAQDGGANTPCNLWDSKTVGNGQHTIKAVAYDKAAPTIKTENVVTFNVSNETAAPPVSTSPSGQAMPVGDLAGWKQIFTDDFNTPVPLGSFPSNAWSKTDTRRNTYPGNKWSAYPTGWRDTKGQKSSDPTVGGWYNPEKTLSINNSMLDIWMHTETVDGVKKRLVAAPMPRLAGPVTDDFTSQLYGRYAVRFRVDPNRLVNNFTGYKTAWLLWPSSNTWPRDGEIDFPEGDLDSSIYGFMHWQGGTSGGDQYYAKSNQTFTAWHTAVIEWGPNRNAFYLDGQLMSDASGGKSEWFDKVPNTPMRWVLQSETELGSTVPAETTEGHIQVDWVAAWSKI